MSPTWHAEKRRHARFVSYRGQNFGLFDSGESNGKDGEIYV